MSSSESERSDVVSGVELGFLKQLDADKRWMLHRCYFPSKLGGKPAWLNPHNLPEASDLKCLSCSKPLIFLLQIYAPNESVDSAFHRTLFIFCCRRAECYKCDSNNTLFKVFRCQLRKENDYYNSAPPNYDSADSIQSCKEFKQTCNVCGCGGDKTCSACKSVSYCSKDHQVFDWKNHKSSCKSHENPQTFISSSQLLFPELELVMEEEEMDDETDDEDSINLDTKLLERSFSPSELEQFANFKNIDKQFTNFRKIVSNYPDQVLRYDKGGNPLWCSKDNQLPSDQVPNCQCGAPRQFECQIMPQILNHMDVQSSITEPSIDWGILVIYTCSKDCTSAHSSYLTEFLYKQDFSHSGLLQ